MKALSLSLASLLVLSAVVALAPGAAAEPCEVPGCNVVGAAICAANEVTDPDWNYKQAVQTIDACTTQTA